MGAAELVETTLPEGAALKLVTEEAVDVPPTALEGVAVP